jgi:hypothetical protein
MLSPYLKTLTAVITGLIGWAVLVTQSDPSSITSSEWVIGATYLATALGVYAVPNIGGPPLTPENPGD